MHLNPLVATHLFTYNAKLLDILGLHTKNTFDALGLQSSNKILNLRTRNKGAMGRGGRGVQGLSQRTNNIYNNYPSKTLTKRLAHMFEVAIPVFVMLGLAHVALEMFSLPNSVSAVLASANLV